MANLVNDGGWIYKGDLIDVPDVQPQASSFTSSSPGGLNLSGVTYNNLATPLPDGIVEIDGYRERWMPQSQEMVRVFDVPWPVRKPFYDAMMGYCTSLPAPKIGQPATLTRTIPAQHPEFPWLYASECNLLNGIGAITNNPLVPVPMICYFHNQPGSPMWGKARVEVIYRHRPYEVLRDDQLDGSTGQELARYVTRTETYAMQALPIPQGNGGNNQLKFVATALNGNANQPIPNSQMTKLFPTREITYTWHEVPEVPEVGIATCMGRVNDKPWDTAYPLSGRYNKGTLLCLAPQRDRYINVAGRWMYTITYKFLFRPEGHNFFPANDGNLYEATYQGGGHHYKDADFDQLFQLL